MQYNIDYFYPEDVLHHISNSTGKTVMYIKSVGPSNCTDQQKIDEIWEFYYDKCPNDILPGLKKTGEIYCYFLTPEQSIEAFNDWFPHKDILEEDEMDFYCYVRIVNSSIGLDMENG